MVQGPAGGKSLFANVGRPCGWPSKLRHQQEGGDVTRGIDKLGGVVRGWQAPDDVSQQQVYSFCDLSNASNSSCNALERFPDADLGGVVGK